MFFSNQLLSFRKASTLSTLQLFYYLSVGWQRLTFPFPFVHHQRHDGKVEQPMKGELFLEDQITG
jgi:hypothetical protein